MPDTNIPALEPSPEPSATTATRARATKTSSAPADVPPDAPRRRRAHFVLQGKGGVGKTFVASALAQWLADAGLLARCFDTDPVNGSFQTIPALGAEPVELLAKNAINAKGVDGLIEAVVAAEGDVVVDNGAASFLPLSRYLVENDIAGVLAEHGVEMVVHTVVTGGGNGLDTLKGLNALVLHFAPAARVVVWVNEFFGPARFKGTDFEHTAVFNENRAALMGMIRLQALDPEMFAPVLAEMLDRKMTFAEAAEPGAFMLMERSRLHRIKAGIWDQIGRVL